MGLAGRLAPSVLLAGAEPVCVVAGSLLADRLGGRLRGVRRAWPMAEGASLIGVLSVGGPACARAGLRRHWPGR